jgi:hypothetical protein
MSFCKAKDYREAWPCWLWRTCHREQSAAIQLWPARRHVGGTQLWVRTLELILCRARMDCRGPTGPRYDGVAGMVPPTNSMLYLTGGKEKADNPNIIHTTYTVIASKARRSSYGQHDATLVVRSRGFARWN